ncbi:MAG: hypothetical protein ACOVMT_05380, partial [Caulobacter sp.]
VLPGWRFARANHRKRRASSEPPSNQNYLYVFADLFRDARARNRTARRMQHSPGGRFFQKG